MGERRLSDANRVSMIRAGDDASSARAARAQNWQVTLRLFQV
jgi:hypothetical protein